MVEIVAVNLFSGGLRLLSWAPPLSALLGGSRFEVAGP